MRCGEGLHIVKAVLVFNGTGDTHTGEVIQAVVLHKFAMLGAFSGATKKPWVRSEDEFAVTPAWSGEPGGAGHTWRSHISCRSSVPVFCPPLYTSHRG